MVPESTIRRISLYLRILNSFAERDNYHISSERLGQETGITATQVRKDISYLGEIGTSGVGYDITLLRKCISEILGTDHNWRVAIVGVGQLGAALLAYPGFHARGFEIVSAFDIDLLKIGKTWEGTKIEDIRNFSKVAKEKNIYLVIICVPPSAAQEVANRMVETGIKAILNFAPTIITVPSTVKLVNVDLAIELEILSHYLSRQVG